MDALKENFPVEEVVARYGLELKRQAARSSDGVSSTPTAEDPTCSCTRMCSENVLTPPSGGGCVGLSRLEGDLVAQILQALDEAALDPLATMLVEVVDAEILIHLRSA
jgi:hypothetical protein